MGIPRLALLPVLACLACMTPQPTQSVPVYAAEFATLQHLRDHCEYRGTEAFQGQDAVAMAKNAAASQGANAVLSFGPARGSHREDTGALTALVPRAEVVYGRCDEAQGAALRRIATQVDAR